MIYASLAGFCIVFYELFVLLGIARDASRIVLRSREAMRVLRSPELDDAAKESLARGMSLEMLRLTLTFALKLALIGVALFAAYAAIVWLRPELRSPLSRSLYSPLVIVAMSVGTVGYAWLRRRSRRRP